MLFTIEWLEKKITSTGKTKYDATLKDVSNIETQNVTIWQDFPGFDTLIAGGQVEGDLVAAKDPKYGPTLYPIRKPVTGAVGAPRGVGMGKVMEKKAENISRAQDRKEEGIMISSTFRAAVETALAEIATLKEGPDGEALDFDQNFKALFMKWRTYYGKAWDVKTPF